MKLSDRVHFAGAQDDVKPWYGMADCFVLPTLYDPFPNAALEAMACGLPLVTSLSAARRSLSIAASRVTYAATR
jgi:UDP-glucose:(heptosyl)LPS alpha-1,3-glucosyltransferase